MMNQQHVVKFNKLLLMFLSDLAAAVPLVTVVATARDCVSALIALDPASTDVLDNFAALACSATEALSTGKLEGLTDLVSDAGILSREDALRVYNCLTPDDKSACWKYITKLIASAKRAVPDLAEKEASLAAAVVPLVQKSDVMGSALVASAARLADALSGWRGGRAEERESAAVTLRHLCSDANELRRAMEQECGEEGIKTLLMSPDVYMEESGIPFVAGGAEAASEILSECEDAEAITAACVHLATVTIALTAIPASTLGSIEKIAATLMQKAQDGDIDIEALTANPLSILETISDAGMTDEVTELMSQLMSMSGVLLTTGKSATGAGASGIVASDGSAAFKESVAVTGESKLGGERKWRMLVSPQEAETNALLVQYVDDTTAEWVTAHVYLARTD
ncbi:hypothetical protein JKP88DRAFT_256005 [Tribonema minus]|uniref:Uncharacterized protein n=1 Tax=Tribonema minus TaxID=303371 RepID=A0A835YUZ1_9STRA|nr:hypothetical protein JKP88DRAFT_256005 [Tribonema minus]